MSETNRILIVDDEDDWLKILAENAHLAKPEYAVALATDADDAIRMLNDLESGEFSEIITDGLGGDYIRLIAVANKKVPPVPVTVTTSSEGMREDVEYYKAKFVSKTTLTPSDFS